MKKTTLFIFFSIFLLHTIQAINTPVECYVQDEYFQCIPEWEIEILTADVNNYTLLNLEACTDTCDGMPFISVTSNYDINNFNYNCSNSGYISIEYILVDACSNTEVETISVFFNEYQEDPDISSCSVVDTAFSMPCNDPNVISVLDAWNANNIA